MAEIKVRTKTKEVVNVTLKPTQGIKVETSKAYLFDPDIVDSYIDLKTSTFIYEQAIAASEWTIEHNLDKRPSVTVVDSADNVIYPAVTYIDDNNIVVTFNAATKGKAYLN